MKKHVTLLLSALLLLNCSSTIIHVAYPEKFEGLTQLILASQTMNVAFTENVNAKILGIVASSAKVRVNSSVTYDFYVDLENEDYTGQYDKKTKTLNFDAPPIRIKKPVINNSTVSYPETGLLLNEDKAAVAILESLTDRFIEEGKPLLEEQRVKDMCKEKLSDHLSSLCKELNYKVEKIEVTFREEGSTENKIGVP